MLAIVAPGQGSQTPGFLTPWLELPNFEDRMRWLGTVAGIDLVEHGTNSDEETIKDTAIAQPLIVASGLVSLLSLFPHPGESFSKVAVGAGHSVGEITAAAAAHVISAEQAMVFVRERGKAMAADAGLAATGMSAVLGGDRADVIACLEKHGLTAANENGGGQIVAAGSLTALDAFAQNPPQGSRVRALAVSGAFHTSTMAPAVPHLASLANSLTVSEPKLPFISNKDGAVVESGREILDRIVGQIAGPVRWDLCMATMAKCGVTGVIEVPPAGTLAGLVKRAQSEIETFTLKGPEDLEAAAAFIAKHGDK